MTRDDIIRMAREANILEPLGYDCPDRKNWRDDVVRSLSKFADLVAAAEREACAKVVENYALGYHEPTWAFKLIAAIRARGQA